MNPRTAIDDFEVPWASFAEFFDSRVDYGSPFLTELNHATGTRHEWTVGQWRERVLDTAAWLKRRGVTEGSSVATLAGNTADALSVAYAAWVVGACCVPLNPGDTLDRQAYIVAHSQALLLIYSDAHTGSVNTIAERSGVEVVATTDLPVGGAGDAGTKWRDVPVGGQDVAALQVYTSGTTGEPKGVVLSSRNLLTDCDAVRLAFDWPSNTRIITVLPIHHVNGLILSSLLPWYAGYSTVLCDRFRSDRFWPDAETEAATVSSVVPSLLEFLLRTEGVPPTTFKEILCGAGPLLTDTAIDFEDRFGVAIRHLYGLSETTAVVTVTPRLGDEDRRRWHQMHGVPSIGPAVPHVEVSVHNGVGEQVGPGERGEIVTRGGVVMQGYAGLPDATADAFRSGWFHTGDEGFWQQPGTEPYFFISGRMKELIIRGGSNISPLEIDAVLRSHPSVDFGLAVPFANRYYGEEIAAYVVTNSPVTEEDLLAHCARHLDYARQPKVIIQGEDVPFTSTGKAKRIELKDRLAPALEPYRDRQFRRSTSALLRRPGSPGEVLVAPVSKTITGVTETEREQE